MNSTNLEKLINSCLPIGYICEVIRFASKDSLSVRVLSVDKYRDRKSYVFSKEYDYMFATHFNNITQIIEELEAEIEICNTALYKAMKE